MNAPDVRWPAVTTPAANFIANRWVRASAGATLSMIDPSEGEPFAAIARSDASDVESAVHAARAAFDGSWGALAPAEKGRALGSIGRAFIDHPEKLALLEAHDG